MTEDYNSEELASFLHEDFKQASHKLDMTYASYLKFHEDLCCDLLTDEVDVDFNTKLLAVIRDELTMN